MGEFSSLELIFCADSYSVSIPCCVSTLARKRPWSLCQKCKWRVTLKHACTLDPTKLEWADCAVQAWCWNGLGNKLPHNSSGNIRPQLSQFAEPLWTDPGLKSGICVHELISVLRKEEEKHRWGMNR